ncbi:MAG: hypothetical protein ABIF71_10975 [Planctomycetota bacterium]
MARFPFRLFFETGTVIFRWGTEPFRAWFSRDTEWVDPAGPRDGNDTFALTTHTRNRHFGPVCEWLFPWENPHPRRPLAGVTITAVGEWNVVLFGLTLQQGAGNPLRRSPKRKLLVEGPAGSTVAVAAARGQVFRVRPTRGPRGAAWLKETVRGRGGFDRGADGRRVHADVFAAPDEQVPVTVRTGKRARKVVFPAAALDAGRPLARLGVTVRKLNTDERYLRMRILDEHGRPTAARVHFADSGGRYLAPTGHPEMPRTEWNIETGGDCVYNGTPYAYVNGDFSIRVPGGDLHVEAAKGFEYRILRRKVRPTGGTLDLRLERAFNAKREGFFTADTHVHFISPTTAVLESAAEDVDVTNILVSQWGDFFTDTWDFTGGLAKVSTRDNLVWVGQENRQHTLGHSSLLGLREPVYPFCTGDADEAELGAELECVIGEWLEKARAQGGLTVIPHFPYPVCENASLIMSGLVDAVECAYSMNYEPEQLYGYYYNFLNLGRRRARGGRHGQDVEYHDPGLLPYLRRPWPGRRPAPCRGPGRLDPAFRFRRACAQRPGHRPRRRRGRGRSVVGAAG